MITKDILARVQAKLTQACFVEREVTCDHITFKVRNLSKRDGDMIDEQKTDLFSDDSNASLVSMYAWIKRMSLAYALVGVDDLDLSADVLTREEGPPIQKHTFVLDQIIPMMSGSVFDKVFEVFSEVSREADARAGIKIEIDQTDAETEIEILKNRVAYLEQQILVTQPQGVDALTQDAAKELIFKPVPVRQEDAPAQQPTPDKASPHPLADEAAFEEERLYQERLAKRPALSPANLYPAK